MFNITQEGPQKGQTVEWVGYLTDKTKDRTAESLVLCGFDGTDSTTIGKNEVLLVIEHEDYTPDPTPTNPNPAAQKRAKVQWINDPARGGAGMVALEGAELAQVDADLRALVFVKREEMNRKAAASGGDAGSFNYGANGSAPQGAPPPPPPPPAPAKAPPRF
jgi:hypothetical protein